MQKTLRKIFNHVDFSLDIPEIVARSDNGKRYYHCDGRKYPSITTVLSELKKDSLIDWRKRVGEEEANKISTQAARRGTFVHDLCELYLNNEEHYLKGQLPNIVESFLPMKPILDGNIDNIYAQEVAMYSDLLKVAGRCDCIAEWDGVPSVIDFKTSLKNKRYSWITNYFTQVTAYSIMWEELTSQKIDQIVVCIAVDNREPQIFIEQREKFFPDLKNAIINFYKKVT